jgi:hypothetical protein
MASTGKPRCSIVSPNVGETLRLYATEQEEAMRKRLDDYRSAQATRFDQVSGELVKKFELNHWFATHQKELGELDREMDALIDRIRQQAECEGTDEVEGTDHPNTFSNDSLQALKRESARLLGELRSKAEQAIVNKYERRLEAVHAVRDSVWEAKSVHALEFSVSDGLKEDMELLRLELDQLKAIHGSAESRIEGDIVRSVMRTWTNESERFRKQIESLVESAQRTRSSSSVSKSSLRRRLLLSIEKRICDLKMYRHSQGEEATSETVGMYRKELLKLLARYMYYMSLKNGTNPGLSRSPSPSPNDSVIDSIWGHISGISSDHKIKFIQTFTERIHEPLIYEALWDVLKYHSQ